ncbi:hypothetical protein BJY52DRAFT_612285 [Lactarius psammicola]|nr:hypothetical protein BJY52DRAFT_612285 [Lactarius psammicola]
MTPYKRTRRLSVIQPANIPFKTGSRSSDRDPEIGVLPDDVLLVIFDLYRVSSPLYWHRLAHVCRRWRRVVFAFPCSLDLRLYCTPKTPVRDTLDYWPPFPIAVRCGGSSHPKRLSPEEEDNIVAVLQHPHRIHSIELCLTSSLVETLGTQVEEPFSKLEDLVILSQNSTHLVLPGTFRWGSRLRSLHSTRVAFSLPQLLSSSPNLVDLQLHDIPRVGYFSPEALASALSGTTKLQSLSLRFLSPASRHSHVGVPPPSDERVVLPSLTRFKFRGTSNNLDRLAARIDAPYLEDIEVAFFNELTFDGSHFGRFLSRIETQKSHRRADIRTSKRTVSICYTQRGVPTRLRLEISCRRLDRQLLSMAQICSHFPAFLLGVRNLGINTTQPTSGHDGVESDQWLGLLCSFSGAEKVHVAGELATDIVHALIPANEEEPTTVLPALRNLYLQEPGPLFAPLRAAAVPFVTSRRLSGIPVTVEYTQRYSRKGLADI